LTNKLDKPDRPELKRIDVRTPAQLEEMKSNGEGARDFMIVDEGQDLMTEKFWNLANHFVRGGLSERQWTWFMDDVNQVGVFGSADTSIREKLQGSGDSHWNLDQNFRNTKKIVETVEAQLGANIGSGSRILGDDPEVQFADTGSDYLDQCEKWLDIILKQMRNSRKALVFLVDISSTTLGNLGMEDLIWNKLKNGISRKNAQSVQEHSLERYDLNSSDNRILVTTPQRAKGLECAYAIIIGDPDLKVNADQEIRRAVASSLYVSMTRAQIRFHAFLPSSWKSIRINESVEA